MYENIIVAGDKHYRRATSLQRVVSSAIDLLVAVSFCITARILFGIDTLLFTVLISMVYLLMGNGLIPDGSVGKRLAGLKVIDARHGGAITAVQDFVRHRYLFFYNPFFLALSAFDASQGQFDKPETYVVKRKTLPPEEIETLQEKPAKLDLEGMRKSLERRE